MKECIYIPERLFVCNLAYLSGLRIEDICSDIDDIIDSDIYSRIIKVREYIDENSNDNISMIPLSFNKFISKMQNKYDTITNCNCRQKNPDYCLFEFYNAIDGLVTKIEKNRAGVSTQDNELITKFTECTENFKQNLNATAISPKNLSRILNPYGESYKNQQVKFVKYFIKNVIPKIIINSEDNLSDIILERDWLDLFFLDMQTSTEAIFVNNDSNFDETQELSIEKYINDKYNKAKENPNELGNLLLDIFGEIIKLYNQNILSHKPFLKSNTRISIDNEQAIDESYYNSIISSNILDFMRWIPMLASPPDDPEFMQSMDNVIEKIRPDILPYIESHILNQDDEKYINDCIFLSENNNLRKMLIKALHSEFSIHSQFHNFYGFTVLETDGGRE